MTFCYALMVLDEQELNICEWMEAFQRLFANFPFLGHPSLCA